MSDATAVNAETPAVEMRGVCFAYDGQPVLEDVTLTIGRRESICIVGPNGGGKTTLVKLMLGLLSPDAGAIRVLGQPPRRGRWRVGYMPQHLRYDPQFPATVWEIVMMGRLGGPGLRGLLGWYSVADRQAARDALHDLGIEALAQRPFAALSGGQRQRVLIARAMCCQPELLILDEPTANVDTAIEARLFEILRGLNRRMAIVVVSHDLGFVSNLVERVVCVNRRVAIHPTSGITGDVIRDIYGGDVRMVDHCDAVSHEGHQHG